MDDIEKIRKLSAKLLGIDRMDSVDDEGEPTSFNMAYTLLEIVGSLRKLEKMLDALESEIEKKPIEDAVHEIGEELRHIKYHIGDSKYYNYV